MSEMPSGFEMVTLKTGEEVITTEIYKKLFLASHPKPISASFNDDYVQEAIAALGVGENSKKVYESKGYGAQVLIRLRTDRGEQPWWAPVQIYRIPVESEYDDIVVVLREKPTPINYYKGVS